MLDALVHRKLSDEQTNMEDVLTSTVFGLLRYAPLEEGLLAFLAQCRRLDGCQGLLLATRPPRFARFDFWPMLKESGLPTEPDLLLTLTDEVSNQDLILIEAKYRSAKSKVAIETEDDPTDQLAREWDHLCVRASKINARPHMIYLTADYGRPRSEIEESISHFAERRQSLYRDQPLDCAWLSWRSLPTLFSDSSHPVLKDLATLATSLRLTFFDGFTAFCSPPANPYEFVREAKTFKYGPMPSNSIKWSFDHGN